MVHRAAVVFKKRGQIIVVSKAEREGVKAAIWRVEAKSRCFALVTTSRVSESREVGVLLEVVRVDVFR